MTEVELKLWATYIADKSNAEAKKALATYYYPFLVNLSRTLQRSPYRGNRKRLRLHDYISYGFTGLHQAIERFDPGRGFQFWTYAAPRVHGAIKDHIRADMKVMGYVRRDVPITIGSLREVDDHCSALTEPDTTGLRLEHDDELEDLLNRMQATEVERQIVKAYICDGLSMKETAALLNKVESRISQIMRKFLKRCRVNMGLDPDTLPTLLGYQSASGNSIVAMERTKRAKRLEAGKLVA